MMISNGLALQDQSGWFDVRTFSASYVVGGRYELATGGSIRTVSFGITGGVGISASAGKSWTWVLEGGAALDQARRMFPLSDPWLGNDLMLLVKDQLKSLLGGY
jgi:hypothetical protein